ncbi:MAG: TIGR00730 family Rossman fold protein [Paludibacteraceae bacterium]
MKIAVYCSAKDSVHERYKRMAVRLGTWIGEQGHTLVYGGATGGLMTSVSNAAKAAGATVVGVVPPRIIAARRLADNCDELVNAENMADRKAKMREIADCFVCLPGSYGTLDEMMDVVASGTVGEHKKPLFVYDYQGFYADLKRQIRRMKAEAFIPAEESYSPVFVEHFHELAEAIGKHQEVLDRKQR